MEIDLGPLNVLICWQTILLALGVATSTHGVKRVIDYSVGGAEARKKRVFINNVILPGVPIFIGCVYGILVPLHPDALTEYITAHSLSGVKEYLIYGVFGMCVGQFSDYVWHRYSGLAAISKRKKAEEPAKEGA